MELLFWGIAFIVFLIIEFAISGLVSVWFAVGSLGASVVALFGGPIWLQVVVFFALTVVVLLVLRPLSKKYINNKAVPTNANSLIGKQAVVKKEIDNINSTGLVEVDGVEWTARSESGEIIEVDKIVEIVKIEGVKVIVK